MIVSWRWLEDYVRLDMPCDVLTQRLTMSGLNVEDVSETDGDVALDLEVTSNRPDCLGHMGVAREIAVLFEKELALPEPHPPSVAESAADVTSVRIDCEDLCPQYIARVIRGVRIGPSPEWLRKRLEAVGITPINNVVDATNYVLMECGQPLHAFDFNKLNGRKIIVRRAKPGETIVAIDQRTYQLTPEMCVIADAARSVAIGGVMGGLETEISPSTTDVLIEAAEFQPVSIRSTARALNLHSDSSYRFERGIDPAGVDWASRRCCQLILDLAGGELLDGAVSAGRTQVPRPEPITLRLAQIPRVLGIDIPAEEAVKILVRLGLERLDDPDAGAVRFVPPSWRRDLTREIDLVEEVARIHGYDRIPQDALVPLVPSAKSRRDRVTDIIRDVLTACGFREAVTLSFVSDALADLFTPRGPLPRLRVEHSSRRAENVLRQSLVPSLLLARRDNERHGNFDADLFELARVYLRAAPGDPQAEPTLVAGISARPFAEMKGIVESLVERLNAAVKFEARPSQVEQFAPGRGADLFLNDRPFGWLGELARDVVERIDLRENLTVFECDVGLLDELADLTPKYSELPRYPGIGRDLNFVIDERITWKELAEVVRSAGGPLLASIDFGGEYRGRQIPAGKKSYVVSVYFQAPDRTLTADEVDRLQQAIVAACAERLGATLR